MCALRVVDRVRYLENVDYWQVISKLLTASIPSKTKWPNDQSQRASEVQAFLHLYAPPCTPEKTQELGINSKSEFSTPRGSKFADLQAIRDGHLSGSRRSIK
ncbi:MAG: hypothetical protein L6R35_001457 [Caloplaca aegaea]|nr:MAG: hypothetical protein L6R35_001457 [Caloplaca aegaea]